jgi:hypothetical protein
MCFLTMLLHMAPFSLLLRSSRVPYLLLEMFIYSFYLLLLLPCCSCRFSFVPYFSDDCFLCFFQHQSLYLLYFFVQLVHWLDFLLHSSLLHLLSINFQLNLLYNMPFHIYPSLQGLQLFTQSTRSMLYVASSSTIGSHSTIISCSAS